MHRAAYFAPVPDPIHVLCVDDSPDVRVVLRLLVNRAEGLTCVGAIASAENLVEETEATGADVIVLDRVIPGCDTLAKIRELGQAGSTAKVVLYSGDDDAGTIDRYMEAGAATTVAKATDPRRLLDAIREVAGAR